MDGVWTQLPVGEHPMRADNANDVQFPYKCISPAFAMRLTMLRVTDLSMARHHIPCLKLKVQDFGLTRHVVAAPTPGLT